jgi:hypothetical protein
MGWPPAGHRVGGLGYASFLTFPRHFGPLCLVRLGDDTRHLDVVHVRKVFGVVKAAELLRRHDAIFVHVTCLEVGE